MAQKKKEFNRAIFDKVMKSLHNNSQLDSLELFKKFNSSEFGISKEQAEINISKYGRNESSKKKKVPVIVQFLKSFANAFVFVLVIIAIITYLTSACWLFVPKSQQSWSQLWIIIVLILASGTITFVQEYKSEKAAEALQGLIKTTCHVRRGSEAFEKIDMKELAIGDIVRLTTGDVVPADVKLIESKDLFISQSALTGESEPVEKHIDNKTDSTEIGEYTNLCLLGTNVVSGNAIGIVVGTGSNTYFGAMQSSLDEAEEKTSFEKSVDNVAKMLLIFMCVMVPLVFILDFYQTKSFINSLLFAASTAIGLTPVMLPTIVSENLAKGAVMMSKKKTVVKKISAIQNIGSMEILCTDKTGTLTDDRIVVEEYMNIDGKVDDRVLKYGYLNSFFQSGLQNVIDHAILEKGEEKSFKKLQSEFTRYDDIPFDFNRRRMSVVINEEESGAAQMITKGALEEMLLVSKYAEINGRVVEITKELEEKIRHQVKKLNSEGMRVIGISRKGNQDKDKRYSVEDENGMILLGFIGFLDPPKESAKEALDALNYYGVDVKVLTGDNEIVTKKVCEEVGLKITNIVLGPEIEKLTDDQLFEVAIKTNVFAKLNPIQKARIVRVLKNGNKIVGFMGDGINDAIALKESDVGISVDTAVDIAKESADVILLEKDLMVLKDGIIEGRKIFANTTKYLKITASSNYGNAISCLLAGIFIPFVPMLPIELLIQNLVYDITQVIIPWDNVDEELIIRPRKWNAKDIGKFMIVFGPTNSIFDITTFIVMWFIYRATGTTAHSTMLFQTGWFMEGFITQVLVLYMLRTERMPFIKSNPSWQLNLSIIVSLVIGLSLPYTAFGRAVGMVYIGPKYFIFLALVIVFYFILSQLVKMLYIKRFKQLL
ncbi:MAG: magnesium-translocating P-type ATPase [Sarcina sp.]